MDALGQLPGAVVEQAHGKALAEYKVMQVARPARGLRGAREVELELDGMGEETVVVSEESEVENAGVVLRGTWWSAAAAGASGSTGIGVAVADVAGASGVAAASAAADQTNAVLLIHGACVDRSFYTAAARELARRFTVVTYDRRGYSDSALPGNSENISAGTELDAASIPDCSVATQAEDAAAIIRALGGGAPMHVVAHSGGCVIAMELARSHPELVRRVILDEPLFLDCLPDQSAFRTTTQRIFKALSEGKDSLALHLFMPTLGATDPRSRAHDETSPELFRANTSHFIQHEYVALSSYVPDYEALRGADLCVLSSELDHGEQYPQCAREVAGRLGAPLYYVPGTHNFPTDLPEEFARFVAGALLL